MPALIFWMYIMGTAFVGPFIPADSSTRFIGPFIPADAPVHIQQPRPQANRWMK